MNLSAVQFPGKHGDEVVVMLVRQHWVRFIGTFIRFILLAALPFLLLVVLRSTMDFAVNLETASGLGGVLGTSAYTLIIWVFSFQSWLDNYLDALIVTSERVIRIEHKGLFNRTVSYLTLDRIQDVTVTTKGMFGSMFGFGSIQIETAGEQQNFVFQTMPHPEQLQSNILMYAKHNPQAVAAAVQSKPRSGGPLD